MDDATLNRERTGVKASRGELRRIVDQLELASWASPAGAPRAARRRDHEPQLPRPLRRRRVRDPGAGQGHRAARDRPRGRAARQRARRRASGIAPPVAAMLDDPQAIVTEFVEGERDGRRASLREPGDSADGRARAARVPRARRAPADALRLLPDRRGPTPRPRRRRGATLPEAYEEAHARAGGDRGGARAAPSTSRCPATTTCWRPNFIARRAAVDRRLGVRGDGRPLLRPRQLRGQQRARRGRRGGAARATTSASRATPRRLAALRLMRFMSDFREAMWGVRPAGRLRARLRLRRLRRQALRPPARDRGRPALRRPGWRRRVSPRAELPDRARCVIIGGGVGGASIAYHLAKLGYRDVVLRRPRRAHLGLDLPLGRARRPAARLGAR